MSIDTGRVRAICFDLDGTLSDTDDMFVLRLSRLLQPFRWVIPGGDVRRLARRLVMTTEGPGNFLHGIPDRLAIDDELAAIGDIIYRAGLWRSKQPFLIIPGIVELLSCLYPDYPMAIVSARGERSAMMFLEQFNLLPYFQCIATAQTCAHTKPYPDPVLWAANQMKTAPGDCLMVGDTTVDILAGRAAGAQTVGVLCGFGEQAELQAVGADFILPSTSKLAKLICESG